MNIRSNDAVEREPHGEVWKEAYEIVGDGTKIAEDFYARISAAQDEQWKFVKAHGGQGFRPGHGGDIRSVLFKKRPPNWRSIGKDQGMEECVPHKGSNAGKQLAKSMSAVVRAPVERDLLYAFGWNGSPIYGGKIYFGAVSKITLPRIRYLVRLPRQIDDGFVVPPELSLITMGEYVQAFEDHNAAVRSRKAGASS
ncbi:MAG: hypothetical protein AB7O46_00220 [Xanthobacteraceae bacterium]